MGEVSQSELAASVLRHYITWKVSLDLVWREHVQRAVVQVTDLTHKVSTLLYQFALWLLVKLVIELSLEFLKFDDLRVLCSLDAIKGRQLLISLRGQLGLHVFNKAIKLFDSFLLCLLDLLDRSLHLTDVVLQVSKTSVEPT